MLHIINGDLLISDCDILAHQANCEGVMNSGIAQKIAKMYPMALEADRSYEHNMGFPRLGRFSYAQSEGKYIVNLYGQLRYRRRSEPLGTKKTSHYMLARAVDAMMSKAKSWEEREGKILKIGLPYGIGCVRGGGDWHIVSDLLQELCYLHKHEMFLYRWEPKLK